MSTAYKAQADFDSFISVKNSLTGEIGGIIYRCMNYTGPFEKGERP